MNKKAVIYARVSTEEQGEHGTSIQAQLTACREYANQNQLSIVGEFVDEYTGTTLDRPGLNELQEVLKNKEARKVIILTEDRLSRSYPETVLLKSIWADQGVDVHFTDTGPEKFTFEGMVISAFREISAHNEIQKLVARTKGGKDRKVEIQKSPVAGGFPAYGYRKVGQGREAALVINDEEAEIVRLIFDIYTGKNGYKPLSLRGVIRHLNGIKAPPPSQRKTCAGRWTVPTISRMLKNELYIGVYWWGKTRMVKKGFQQKGVREKQPKEKWTKLELPELAIIDEETFSITQARFERNKRLSKRNRKHNYLMSGFMQCAVCGTRCSGHTHKKLQKRQFYYRCADDYKKALSREYCKYARKTILAHKVDNAVWFWIEEILCNEEILLAGLQKMMSNRAAKIAPLTDRIDKLDSMINESEVKTKRLINEMANYDDELVLEAIRQEIHLVTERRNALQDKLDRLSVKAAEVEITSNDIENIMNYAAQFRERIGNGSYEKKRDFMERLGVKAKLHLGEKWVYVECGIPGLERKIMFRPPGRCVHHVGDGGV